MDLSRSRLVLRDRGPLESLDAALVLARALGRAWLGTAVLAMLPWTVLLGAWVAWRPESPWPWVVAFVVGPLVQAPMLRLGEVALFGEVGPVWRVVASAIARVDVLAVLLGRGLVWGVTAVMCLGLPTAVIVPASWWLPETHALERRGLSAALRRSGHLASQSLGHVVIGATMTVVVPLLGVLAAETTMAAVVGTVLQLGAPFGSLFDGQGTPWAMAGLLGSWVLIAWARLVMYLDARTRTEGWDLQLEVDDLMRRGAA